MAVGLIIGLTILGILLLLALAWILFSFHPSKSGKILVGDDILSIYCIRDGMVNFYALSSGNSHVLIDSGTGKKTALELRKLGIDIAT